MADSFSFQAKVTSYGYHVYKEITWRNVTVAIESNEASKQIDPHCCVIQIKSGESVVTIGHIPREISRHCFFFLKKEGGKNNGNVFSTTYRTSTILSGDSPGFASSRYVTHCKIKKFAQTIYDFRNTGT